MAEVTTTSSINAGKIHVDKSGQARMGIQQNGTDLLSTIEEQDKIFRNLKIEGKDPEGNVILKRAPVPVINATNEQITKESAAKDALLSMSTLLGGLRGKAIGGDVSGVFTQMTVLSASTDTAGVDVGDIISIQGKDFDPTNFILKVKQLARADNLSGTSGVANITTALNWTGNITVGTDRAKTTIAVTPTMNLDDIMREINLKSTTTGVRASFSQIATNDVRLQLNGTRIGEPLVCYSDIAAAAGKVPQSLGANTSTKGAADMATALGWAGNITVGTGGNTAAVAVSNGMNLQQVIDAINTQMNTTKVQAIALQVGPNDYRLHMRAIKPLVSSTSIPGIADKLPASATGAAAAGVADPATALNWTGTITVGSADKTSDIAISANMTLQNVVDAINQSQSASGVKASIKQASLGDYRLAFEPAPSPFAAITVSTDFTSATGHIPSGIGVSTARFGTADTSTALGWTGALDFGAGEMNASVNLLPNMNLQTVVDTINAKAGDTGIKANIIQVGAADFRLNFTAIEPVNVSSNIAASANILPNNAGIASQGVVDNTAALNWVGLIRLGTDSKTADINVNSAMSMTDVVNAINAKSGESGVTAETYLHGIDDHRIRFLTPPIARSINVDGTISNGAGMIPESNGTNFSALSSVIEFNGARVERSSNQIMDLIQGATFELLKAAPNTTASVELGRDTDAALKAVASWVDSFNKLISGDQFKTKVGESLWSQIQTLLGATTPGLSADVPRTLAEIGIRRKVSEGEDRKMLLDGTLEVDLKPSAQTGNEIPLVYWLKNRPDVVESIFGNAQTNTNKQFLITAYPNATPPELDGKRFQVSLNKSADGATATASFTAPDGTIVQADALLNGDYVTITGKTGTLFERFQFAVDGFKAMANGSAISTDQTFSQGIGSRLTKLVSGTFERDAGFDIILNNLKDKIKDAEAEKKTITERLDAKKDRQIRSLGRYTQAMNRSQMGQAFLQQMNMNAMAAVA